MNELAEVVETLDTLAKYGLLFGGTRLRRRMIVHVRLSPSYIVIKYDDGGTQYIDRRRRLAVHLPRHVPKEVAEALDVLAKRGLLHIDDRRVVAVQRVGRRVEAVTEDGKRSRVKWLTVQLSP